MQSLAAWVFKGKDTFKSAESSHLTPLSNMKDQREYKPFLLTVTLVY